MNLCKSLQGRKGSFLHYMNQKVKVFFYAIYIILKNKGKCGVCGDNWADSQPRPHEGGGRYGQGVIGRRYTTGQVNSEVS